MGKDNNDAGSHSHVVTTTMWKFAVGLVALIFAGLLFVNEQFLTIREHTEYKLRVDQSLTDLGTSLRSHTAADNLNFIGRNEFERWLKQNETRQLEFANDIHRIENSRPTAGELQAVSASLDARIKRLEDQLQVLQNWQKKINEQK